MILFVAFHICVADTIASGQSHGRPTVTDTSQQRIVALIAIVNNKDKETSNGDRNLIAFLFLCLCFSYHTHIYLVLRAYDYHN